MREHDKLMIISWLQDGVLDACLFLAVGIVITWEKGCIQLGKQQEHHCHLHGWGCSRHEHCSITPPPCLQAHSELADGKTEAERRGGACRCLARLENGLWPPNIFVDLAPSVLLQGKRGHVSEGRVKGPLSKGRSPVPLS